jgi:hypothetical protein
MYIIEVKENNKWKFRSKHKNITSAECNYEAIKTKPIRIKKDGTIIASKDATIHQGEPHGICITDTGT